MEELQRRLEFSNRTIKLQAIKRLSDAIIEKYKSSMPINGLTLESVELNLLWEKCVDPDVIVCQAACDCAVSFVICRQAEFGFVLSKLVTLASIAKNYTGVVNAVGDLLMLHTMTGPQTSDSKKCTAVTYSCPFTISSPHPLITLLVGQPDCWPVLVQLLERLFATVDRRCLLVMLEPFVKLVFSEPNQTATRLPLQLSLWSLFLQNIRWNQHEILHFLFDLVSCLSINVGMSSGNVAFLVNSLGRQMLMDGVSDESSLNVFIIHALVLASSLIQGGTDVLELIRTVLAIVTVHKDNLSHSLIILHCVLLLPLLPTASLALCLEIVSLLLLSSDFKHTDSLIVSLLVLPVLQILATPELFTRSQITTNASSVFSAVEGFIKADTKNIRSDSHTEKPLLTHSNVDGCTHKAVLSLIHGLRRGSLTVHAWLKSVASAMKDRAVAAPPYLVSSLVAGLLVTEDAPDVVQACLNTLQQLAAKDVTLSVQLLPLLLYKLSKIKEPNIRLQILDSIPKCATHKAAVGPVLATVRMLSSHPKLRAVSLCLMSSLWQRQERCFVHFLQMLENSLSHNKSLAVSGVLDDVLLSRAACIRDICAHSATKHGEEVVAHLYALVNDCTSVEEAPVACLALQGLCHLCEAEVIDIRTTWNAFAAKLKNEKRPLVIVDITRLLALVPELQVDSKEYQVFTNEIVSFLWILTRHLDSRVAGNALRALSHFPPDLNSIDYFPEQIKQLQQQEMAKLSDESADNDGDKEDDKEISAVIFGICYVKLFQLLPPDVIPGFESLLIHLVSYEASNFPRGITFSASQTQVTKNRALSSIPSHLLDQFESNQKPGLRPNFAVGLLFCYESPVTLSRDGKRRLQNLVSRGKDYHQMLYTLINDIPVEPSKWYQCIAKIPAWAAFMDRCFRAYTESCVAELELELEKGKSKDPVENQLYQKGAWLWARDKLTDMIKTSSRGNPVVQGNCMSALAGLAVAVTNYVAGLDPEIVRSNETLTEHLKQPHWFTMIAETLLTVIDAGYQSKSRIFAICTQKTSNQDQAAQSTILARASASVSISLLMPFLVSANTEMVYAALNLLADSLPGKASDTVSDVLQMHCGMGMGLSIQKLLREHFVDVAGTKGMEVMWNSVRALETSAFSTSSARVGSLVGLAICIDALCMDVNLGARPYVTKLHDQIVAVAKSLSSDRDNEPLLLCLAILTGASYAANITSIDIVNKDIERFVEIFDTDPVNVELCRAIGTLFYMLQSANYPNIKDLIRKFSSAWKNSLNAEKVPGIAKVAALTGLSAIVGCHSSLTVIPSEDSSIIAEIGLEKDVIAILKSSYTLGQIQVQNTDTGAWLLGLLYLSRLNAGGRQQTTLPPNYHFLPQTSVLRPLVDLLTEFSKKGPDKSKSDIDIVATILRAMTNDGALPFPPLNWPAILGPILHLPFGPVIEELCIRLAIQQSVFLPSLSSFISTCLVSPFYNGLKSPAKQCIARNLHVLIRVVPLTVLRDYFENSFVQPFNCLSRITSSTGHEGVSSDEWNMLTVMFTGLEGALKEKEPPQNVSTLIWKTLENICELCSLENIQLWRLCCTCLRHAPDHLLDNITSNYLKNERTYLKGFFMRCFLVAVGNQPLVWLNQAIETVAYNPGISDFSPSIRLLFEVFRSVSESCQPQDRMQWLLELMGLVKNLVIGTVPVANQDLSVTRIVWYLMVVFLTALISWSDSSSTVILGLSDNLTPLNCDHWLPEHSDEKADKVIFSGRVLEDVLMQLAPVSLMKLLAVKPWTQLTGRIAEWLLALYDAEGVFEQTEIRKVIKDCLFALRDESEFKKVSVWGRIVMLK